MKNKIMNVDIVWIDYGSSGLGISGEFGGTNFTGFTIDEVFPGTYRLTRHLPRPSFNASWKRETFHGSPDDAKEAAKVDGAAFFQSVGGAVAAHPVIRNMDKVTQLVFPAQLCDERCGFYGGDSVHEDVTVEKAVTGEWTIARSDGTLFRNPNQTWEAPKELVVDGESCAWLQGLLWPLEEALEQVHFMHCG